MRQSTYVPGTFGTSSRDQFPSHEGRRIYRYYREHSSSTGRHSDCNMSSLLVDLKTLQDRFWLLIRFTWPSYPISAALYHTNQFLTEYQNAIDKFGS